MSELVADLDGPFRFQYEPGTIRFGEGCVAHLSEELERRGLSRALVVSGQTVGTTEAVIEPVKAGLGDRLAGVFAETTPKKRLATAVAAAERYRELDADVLIGLGGGSSLDVTKQAAVAVASDRSPAELGTALAESGLLPVPESVPPIVSIPTTLAGAELSMGGGASAHPDGGLVDEPTGGGVGHPSLMPMLMVADPALFATTPQSVLAASAMNGFDKGIEAIYGPKATPITDGTAAHGLSLLVESLPALGDDPIDAATMNPIVRGILLVEYGMSRPDATTMSLIHAFGHAVSARGPHQGTAHAVVAPHVLEYVFGEADGRRAFLAEALGVGDAADHAAAVVSAVSDLRDALGQPRRLRDVDGLTTDDIPKIVDGVLDDRLINNLPPGVEADRDALDGIVEAAW